MADENAHKIRIDTPGLWTPALVKVARLAARGYLNPFYGQGGRGVSRKLSVTDIIRRELTQFVAETDAQSIKRLGLKRSATQS